MVKKLRVIVPALLCVSVMALSGCSSKKATDAGMKTDAPAVGKEESLDSKPMGILEGRTSGPMRPVYFDFDQSVIRADQIPSIEQNGAFLSNNPSKNVLIEGNTDNRGTNEYNMALGERRALSAKKYLIELGVSEGRIRTISYGEERPLFLGGSEDDSTYNRRDDFILE